jgi:hypothetical protein
MVFGMTVCETSFMAVVNDSMHFANDIYEIFLISLLDASCSCLDIKEHRRMTSKVERDVITQIAIRRIDWDCECFPLLD